MTILKFPSDPSMTDLVGKNNPYDYSESLNPEACDWVIYGNHRGVPLSNLNPIDRKHPLWNRWLFQEIRFKKARLGKSK